MEFVNLVKEYNRMCDSIHCLDCQINKAMREHGLHNEFDYMSKYPEEFAEIVESWSEEHPIKTNRDKLKEIVSETFGVPVERLEIGSCSFMNCKGDNCKECPYSNFWNKEYTGE